MDICNKVHCTACGACLNVCPRHCVSYKQDVMGHFYPKIDIKQCIHCHACEKVCPANHPLVLNVPIKAFAAWHKNNDDYKSAASGGVATAFAQKIISDGGVVYGCAWTKKLGVEHIRIDTYDDIKLLRGSKYAQSKISATLFRSVKSDLKKNIKVLFVGTSCQVAGLKSFLKKDYDNLYLVDLICHGVPSSYFLRKHVKKIVGKVDDVDVSFRDDTGKCLTIRKDNQIVYRKHIWYQRYEDAYYACFDDGLTFRDSCFTCAYGTSKRVSDVTIGDFWGLSDDFQVDHRHGCSCILPISSKGMWLIQNSSLHLYERTVDEAVNGNSQLRSPCPKSNRIKIFRLLCGLLGFHLAYYLIYFDHLFFVLRCKAQFGTRLKNLFKR